jgi:hypothetical protein
MLDIDIQPADAECFYFAYYSKYRQMPHILLIGVSRSGMFSLGITLVLKVIYSVGGDCGMLTIGITLVFVLAVGAGEGAGAGTCALRPGFFFGAVGEGGGDGVAGIQT